MTTTHPHDEAASVTPVDTARQKRLQTLLVRRERLSTRWAEEFSHHLPGADELAYELAVVEQALGHCFQNVFDQHYPEWVAQEAAMLHTVASPSKTCRLCEALADGPAAA